MPGSSGGARADSEDPDVPTRDADEWIARRLREINYDLGHPDVQQLADHLEPLGVGTLVNLKTSGTLFQACRKLIPGVLPPPPASWHDEFQRIIVVTVRSAIPMFIKRSMPDWDSSRSAIDTYFVNYCLITFKKEYVRYCREEAHSEVEFATEKVIDMFDARTNVRRVEDSAIAKVTVREVIKLVGSPEFAEYVRLTARGLTRAQTAEVLGISISTLDRHIKYWRKQLDGGGWSVRRGREEDRGR